jgi:hypothetical protein
VGAVHTRAGPVELAGRTQLGEQNAVQPVEDPCLLPPLQTPPAGLSGAELQLQRQQLSGNVVAEDVQDARRICVEDANAEHRQWRPLQRYTGRREDRGEIHLAVAGLIFDRAARCITRHRQSTELVPASTTAC